MTSTLLNRAQLAKRWNCSVRNVDRLRRHCLLPWIDLTAGQGGKPLVRFRIDDIEEFEKKTLMNNFTR